MRLTELKDLKSQLRFDILDDGKDQLSNTDGRIEAVEKSISELDESVAHTVLQEGIQERVVGETMDVPIPQVMEKTIEVTKAIPRKRLQQRTANADKPGVRVQVFKGERAVEQILDVPVPEMEAQLLEVPKIIHQDRILQRTVKQVETSGADGQTYPLFQESSSAALQASTDLKGFEMVI